MPSKKGTTSSKATSANAKKAAAAGAAALAAVAAAGVATYYFYGTKNAKKHRQAASKWATGMRKDVQKGVKALKKIDSKTVARVVDDAAAAYQGMRGVAAEDVRAAAKELKANWKQIEAEMAPSASVKRAVKKAVKSVSKAPPAKKATKKKSAK